jgi:hypothetical protein
MKIACIGWGSLIWDPRALPIQREWFKDGPFAPVEYTRQSSDGRITLVLNNNSNRVRTLWAIMLTTDLKAAKEALRDRENISGNNWELKIGSWNIGEPTPSLLPDLPNWVNSHSLDAAIWTSLGPRFNNEDIAPTSDQVIRYLQSLLGAKRENAEKYIRFTPRQIDTEYRRKIEASIGWSFKEP